MTIEEGKVAIIPAPTRGRQAEPIPEDLIAAVLSALEKVEKDQVVSTGRFFEKPHQAQAYRNRLIEALASADGRYNGNLGSSVIDKEGNPARKDSKGPFVLAVRKQG
jgi:hypothetical protein